MAGSGKLCIAAYVFGDYSKYIPFYIYSVLKSYPEYYVKIFIEKDLSKSEKKCLDALRNEMSDHFSICKDRFRGYDFLNGTNIRGGGKKILRWLIPENEFDGFDYVYIGDVDFIIIREEPSLLESHLRHCEKTHLPFSNKIRLMPGSSVRTDRMTGLHFIIKKPYYGEIGQYISKYLQDNDCLIKSLSGLNNNEQFLYHLLERGFELDRLLLFEDFRPHHGIHLGIARRRGLPAAEILKRLTQAEMDESYELTAAKNYLINCLDDRLFQNMLSILPEESIFNVCDALDLKMPSIKLKLQSFKNVIRRKIWAVVLKLYS